MNVWFRQVTPEEINRRGRDTMSDHMGVVFTEVGPDYLRATMPVDHRTIQYMGILHGGASAFLSENIASVGANLAVNPDKKFCVGLEINANHLRSVSDGVVTATARPLHRGKTTHVWDVRIEDQQKNLVCVSRMTLAVRERRHPQSPQGLAEDQPDV